MSTDTSIEARPAEAEALLETLDVVAPNALHRWDLAGDDEASADLLAQSDLLGHAVRFVGRPLCERGLRAGAGTRSLSARIRADGHDDLVVEVRDGTPATRRQATSSTTRR